MFSIEPMVEKQRAVAAAAEEEAAGRREQTRSDDSRKDLRQRTARIGEAAWGVIYI